MSDATAEAGVGQEGGPVIDVRNLDYFVPNKHVLKGVNLTVGRGEICCVMGMSGCGKTSLLHCIGGLAPPTSGTIAIDGNQIVGMRESELNTIREHMGMVFQYAALFDFLSVFENVAFGLRRRRRLPEKEVDRIVKEKLALAAVPGTESLFPSQLSGGMAKRVGLARALALEPQILLYDEPTSGLDPIVATVIDEQIMRMRDQLGVTSVVVSHNMPSVLRISDKIAMMNDGRIVAFGTTDEIKKSSDPVVQQFMHGRTNGPLKIA
jgi:phospholipid/cholesterol/gamma-HCH transport system ATP-binding protein